MNSSSLLKYFQILFRESTTSLKNIYYYEKKISDFGYQITTESTLGSVRSLNSSNRWRTYSLSLLLPLFVIIYKNIKGIEDVYEPFDLGVAFFLGLQIIRVLCSPKKNENRINDKQISLTLAEKEMVFEGKKVNKKISVNQIELLNISERGFKLYFQCLNKKDDFVIWHYHNKLREPKSSPLLQIAKMVAAKYPAAIYYDIEKLKMIGNEASFEEVFSKQKKKNELGIIIMFTISTLVILYFAFKK